MLGRLRRQRKRASHPSPNFSEGRERNGRAVELITLYEFGPRPQNSSCMARTSESIAGWKALADRSPTDQPCSSSRPSTSSRYLDVQGPACVLQVGRDGVIVLHVRLALWPFRLDADRSGYVDIRIALIAIDPTREGPPRSTWKRSARPTTPSSTTSLGSTSHTAASKMGSGCLRALLGTRAPAMPDS